MDLHPDQLRALLAVAELGTFDAAAKQLHVTPSAISQRMKALEAEVGRVLLSRTKPVALTPSGQVVLRLARQLALLQGDAERSLDSGSGSATIAIPIAINADSLATWALPALAELAASGNLTFDIYREDQAHSTGLLRAGTVMAAVTSEPVAVQGCTVRAIGQMRYRPMASRAFAERWFPNGPTPAALAAAPVVLFDRKDTLQHEYLTKRAGIPLSPEVHAPLIHAPLIHDSRIHASRINYIPTSVDFARAIELGFGWGMLPDAQAEGPEAAGTLVAFDPEYPSTVPLFWQQWTLESTSLAAVAAAMASAAPSH